MALMLKSHRFAAKLLRVLEQAQPTQILSPQESGKGLSPLEPLGYISGIFLQPLYVFPVWSSEIGSSPTAPAIMLPAAMPLLRARLVGNLPWL